MLRISSSGLALCLYTLSVFPGTFLKLQAVLCRRAFSLASSSTFLACSCRNRTGSSSQPCPRSPAGSPVGPPLVAPGSQCSESLAPVGQTSPAQPSHDHDRRCEPFLSEYDCLVC